MSKTTTRYPLAHAQAWALEALDALAICSPRVQIAGSIRREREDVGDIDLVLLDKGDEDPWMRHSVARALHDLGYTMTKDGNLIASFVRVATSPLDLYYATPDTWGTTLLIRTGSAAHNIKLVEAGKKRLPARLLKVSQGVVDTAGRVIASRTEEEIFAALGVPYVAPEDREAPEYQSWIREDVS